MTTPLIIPHGDAEDPIFGREHELARLYELVDGIHERGAVLIVRGEAGIGKSTLLSTASRRADAKGIRVLHATGVQSETQLPFAGLHQLVDALGLLPWAEKARQQLRASGVASRPRPPNPLHELTPQELQIARMAASGLSNREIGQQLYHELSSWQPVAATADSIRRLDGLQYVRMPR